MTNKLYNINYTFYQYNDGRGNNGTFKSTKTYTNKILFEETIDQFSKCLSGSMVDEEYDNFINSIIPGLCGGRLLSFSVEEYSVP